MNSPITLKLDFQKDEVVSAQQMEMLESNRSRIMMAIAILAFLGAVVQQIRFGMEDNAIPTTWWMPVLLLIAAAVGFGFAYFYKPVNDFRINPLWQTTYQLHLSSEQFALIPEGKSKGFELPWSRIKRVLENDKVFILFWDSEQDLAILPKRVLQAQEKYLRDNLSHISGLAWKVRQ